MEMKSVRFLIRTEPHSDYFHAYLVCGHNVIAKALGTTPDKAIENLNGHSIAISDIVPAELTRAERLAEWERNILK